MAEYAGALIRKASETGIFAPFNILLFFQWMLHAKRAKHASFTGSISRQYKLNPSAASLSIET
jgi:hypothetical protein